MSESSAQSAARSEESRSGGGVVNTAERSQHDSLERRPEPSLSLILGSPSKRFVALLVLGAICATLLELPLPLSLAIAFVAVRHGERL